MTVTKEQIVEVLARKDTVGMHAVGRALVHLFNRQTSYEQAAECTSEHNGVGFTGVDGEIGASMAKFYKSRGFLSPKQVAVWQKPHGKTGATKISKYWGQIMEEAYKKEAASKPEEEHIHDEDGEIALMNKLETDLEQREETEQEAVWNEEVDGDFGNAMELKMVADEMAS